MRYAVVIHAELLDDTDEKGARFFASTPLEEICGSMKSALETGDVENAALPVGFYRKPKNRRSSTTKHHKRT